eukprot:5237895-Amphidinium_carterae.1
MNKKQLHRAAKQKAKEDAVSAAPAVVDVPVPRHSDLDQDMGGVAGLVEAHDPCLCMTDEQVLRSLPRATSSEEELAQFDYLYELGCKRPALERQRREQ